MALGSGYPAQGFKPPHPRWKPPVKRPPAPMRKPPVRPSRPKPGERPKRPPGRLPPPPPPSAPRPRRGPPNRPTRRHWWEPLFDPPPKKPPGFKPPKASPPLRVSPIIKPMLPWRGVPSPWDPFFDPWTDIPAFILPRQELKFDLPPGWVGVKTCPPDPTYNLGIYTRFSRVMSSSPPPNCLTLQACVVGPSGGGTKTCAGAGNAVQVSFSETKDVSGTPRCHNLAFYRWNCTVNGGQPDTTNWEDWIVQPRPAVIPPTMPDPFAQQPPGLGQPLPQPIPFYALPKAPDPNAWLPTPGVIVLPQVNPDPFVWVPALQPLPAGVPTPAPGPGTLPPQPFPRPGNPFPVPVARPQPPPGNPIPPRPYLALAPGTAATVYPSGRTKAERTFTHARVKPKKKEREKKIRTPAFFNAIFKAVGSFTEAADLIDVTYKSIPCSVKYNAGMMGHPINIVDKANFIASHAKDIDATEFMRNYAKNQFEDAYYGMLSPEKAYYQQLFKNTGISGGGKFAYQQKRDKYEQENTDPKWKRPKDPVITAFNDFVDSQMGPVPAAFTCPPRWTTGKGGSGKKPGRTKAQQRARDELIVGTDLWRDMDEG